MLDEGNLLSIPLIYAVSNTLSYTFVMVMFRIVRLPGESNRAGNERV